MKGAIWVICSVVGAAFVLLSLHVMGLMVVRDTTGQIVSAAATNNREVHPLYAVPGGLFVGFTRVEGVIEIRCRDGSNSQRWYVTRTAPEWQTVVGPHPCI